MFVHSVSRSSRHGFSKTPRESLHLIAGEGIEGDAHRGCTTQHLYLMRRDPMRSNLCQVHLFASEMLAELSAAGFDLQPGDLGENILTTGLDLLNLPAGTLLHLGAEAVVEVTGLRTPCKKIDDFRPGLQALLWNVLEKGGEKRRRAGIMSAVRTGGIVHPGDPILIELPPPPYQQLGPV